jgi:L-iditol 2-dehydrogenase
LIASGRFLAAEFLTARASLEELPAVFERMMTRSARDIKTAIFPGHDGFGAGAGVRVGA